MRRSLPFLIVVLVPLLALFGCGSDSSAPTGTTTNSLIQGEIGTADFEINVSAASGNGRDIQGPFVLRGRNLQYVDSLAALVVDLTVRNNGRVAHPEPVTLTFVDLIPSSVTVLNPDNGINGDGAMINFSFANDDGLWTPAEESLPRTVQFGVESGVSIGFVGQLGLGEPADAGTIGGLVWNDANQDGVVDEGEEGISGVLIALSNIGANATFAADDDDDDCDDDHDGDRNGGGDDDDCDDGDDGDDDHPGVRFVRTGEDGRYLFENVPAGAWVVTRVPKTTDTGMPTTSTVIYVLLTESDGDVNDFLDANFGWTYPAP